MRGHLGYFAEGFLGAVGFTATHSRLDTALLRLRRNTQGNRQGRGENRQTPGLLDLQRRFARGRFGLWLRRGRFLLPSLPRFVFQGSHAFADFRLLLRRQQLVNLAALHACKPLHECIFLFRA